MHVAHTHTHEKNIRFLTGCALPKPSFESPHPSKRGPPVAGLDGNWSCEACGNVNFQFRDTCNRCATPKPYVQPAGQKPIAGINGNWECEACGNVNFPHRDRCNRCSTPKQPAIGMAPAAMAPTAAPQSKGPPQAGVDGNWTCSACGNVNFAKRDRCNRCSAPKPLDVVEEYGMTQPLVTSTLGFTHRGPPVAGVDGNWACPQCQNINFAHRSSCNRCDSFAKRFNSKKLGQKKYVSRTVPAGWFGGGSFATFRDQFFPHYSNHGAR